MEKKKIIKENPIFSPLPDEGIEWISERIEERHFKRGDIVFRENEKGDKFYIIKKGRAQVLRENKEVAILGKGDFFGEMALIEEKMRSATIKALTELEVLELEKDTFLQLLREFPLTSLEILKVLSQRVRETNERMIEHLIREERLATIGKMAGTVIHDLKGPIAVIKGYTGLLKREDITAEEKREFLSIISSQIETLLHMIEDVLEFARGKEHFHPVKINLLKLVREAAEPLREKFKEKRIDMEIKGEDVEVEVDPLKMRRVLNNLLVNANEAMEEEGKVTIGVRKEEEYGVIEVEDTGKGIPKDVLPKLFDPFFSFQKPGGTGLGMTIVKKIIDEHKGKIEVESKEGRGTKVRIKIPI